MFSIAEPVDTGLPVRYQLFGSNRSPIIEVTFDWELDRNCAGPVSGRLDEGQAGIAEINQHETKGVTGSLLDGKAENGTCLYSRMS